MYDSLHTNFPGVLPGSVILERTVSELEPFGLDGENTLYGQSICPDEINNEKGDLALVPKSRLSPFSLDAAT